jgi:hypothetical protein
MEQLLEATYLISEHASIVMVVLHNNLKRRTAHTKPSMPKVVMEK